MVAGLIISRVAHYYKILTGSVLNNDQSFYCSYIQFSLIYSLNLYQFHLNIQGIGACVGGIYRGDIIDQEAYIGHLQKIRWWPHCGLTAEGLWWMSHNLYARYASHDLFRCHQSLHRYLPRVD